MASQSTAGWLRYAIPPDPPRYHGLPHAVVLLGNNAGQAAPEELTAADELDRGLGHMVAGTDVVLHRFDPRIDAIVLGTTEALHRARIGRNLPGWTEKPLPEEGFRIVHLRRGIREWYILQGGSPRAELWAAFRFAALVAEDQQLPEDLTDAPHLPLRAMDLGRGPGALALLQGGAERPGLLRLFASVGINALIVDRESNDAVAVADAIRPFGMRIWLRSATANLTGAGVFPGQLPGLTNLGGIALSLPPGASQEQFKAWMQRANLEAHRLQPRGSSVLLEAALGPPLREPVGSGGPPQVLLPEERASMLRGALEPNVILGGAAMAGTEADYGPASFGPGSATFGLLPQQPQLAVFPVLPRLADHLAYPAGIWATALQTPERGARGDTTLAALLTGTGAAASHSGVAGILLPADGERLLRQPLLQANLYAFGRLAWSPALQVEALTEEWSRQTWGDDARAYAAASRILLDSTAAAEKNRAALGLPLLASAAGDPDPSQAEHLYVAGTPLADGSGIGVDRTAAGTGEILRYPDAFARMLADPARCPAEWLLLLHRLPYRAMLPGGTTVAQAFYDAHFLAAAQPGNALDAWESTRGLVDEPRYTAVQTFLARAATHAEIWRESTTEWMQRTSGVPDLLGFVGSHPGRIEVENMQLAGFKVEDAARATVSGGREAVCAAADCTATTKFTGGTNVYRVEVGYANHHDGSSFQLLVNGEVRARWQDPSTGAPTEAERFLVNGVRLEGGDTIAVHAVAASGHGWGSLDFLEISRDPRWN